MNKYKEKKTLLLQEKKKSIETLHLARRMIFKNAINPKSLIAFFALIIYFRFMISKQTELINKNNDVKLVLEKTYNQSDVVFDSILRETPRKFSVISASLFSESYHMFNLPFVALAWRRIGIEPIILLVKSNSTKPSELTNKTIEYLNKFKIKIVDIQSPDGYDVTVGMLSRLFVGLLPQSIVKENDFILTSDADLIPINKNYYAIDNSNHIRAWDAFCCEPFMFEKKNYNMYPLSHIGMKKYQWSEVMTLNVNKISLDGQFILNKIGETFNEKSFIQINNILDKGSPAW